MTVFPTVVRVTVILLALAGISGHVAYLDAIWWHRLGLASVMTRDVRGATILLLSAHAVVSIVCSGLSVAMVLSERPRQEAARALAVAFASWGYLMSYSGVTLLLRPVGPGTAQEIFEAHFLAVEVLGLVGLLRFVSIFPRPLSEEELEPLDTLPRVFLPVHRAAVRMRHRAAPPLAGASVLVGLLGWTLLSGGELSDAGLSRGMDIVRFAAAGLVVMNLRRAWRRATEGDRDGLTWMITSLSVLVGSLALLIGGNVLVAVTGFPEPDVAWRPILLDLGLIGFMTALSMCVLARGRHDPAQVARRVASAAIVISAGLVLAAGLEALFSGGGIATSALRPGVGTAVAFAVVLSTFRATVRSIEERLPQ